MCRYCAGKVLKAVVQVDFPAYAQSMHMSYKMAKFDKQTFCSKEHFCMTPLHAHAQYICIVYAKYQKASVKDLVPVGFTVYALSKHKQIPYLKANRNNG